MPAKLNARPLGLGLRDVLCVGVGGMPLSRPGRPEESDAIKVIHASLDAGVTLLDTADVYSIDEDDLGHNERLFANALRSWEGASDSITVATKGGMTRTGQEWGRDGRPEQIKVACERSLKALGVERITLYQYHSPDDRVAFKDSVGAFKDLQDEGKIKHIGLSNVSVGQIKEAEKIVTVCTVQNRLNPFFREAIEEGVLDYCEERGIGFLAYSPVGGGRLNKKLPDHPVVHEIAKRHGMSEHSVVLTWVLSRSPSVIVIPAARRIESALDSIKAAGATLPEEDLAAITNAEFSRA